MKKHVFSQETAEFFLNEGVFSTIVGEINRQFGRCQASKLFKLFVAKKYDPIQVINTISWCKSVKGSKWYDELEETYIMHMFFKEYFD